MKIAKEALILVLIIMGMISCGGRKEQSTQTDYALPDTIEIIRGNGRVVPQNGILSLTAEVSGTIDRIYVTSGDKVHEGDTLMVLDTEKAQISLSQTQSKVQVQQSGVRIAESEVKQCRMNLQVAKSELEVLRRLYAKGAESLKSVTDKEQEVQLLEVAYEKSRQELVKSQRSLRELEDGVRLSRKSLGECIILAPSDGEILDVDIERGSTVREYDRLATFAADEPIIVEAEVDELFANRLQIGQKATIHLIGYPDTIGTGHIYNMMDFLSDKSIFSGETSEQQDRQMRKIKIMLDDQSRTPLIGSKVSCNILL